MEGVRFLVLMLTERCNLACSYCYARAGAEGRDMDRATAWRALELMLPRQGKLTVQLAGGEPLLNWPLVRELAQSRDRSRLRLALQSNGLLLDRPKIEFLAKHRVALGLSLDGSPLINDRLRGGGERVLKCLDLLAEAGLGVNLTVVLTRHNLGDLPRFLLLLARKPAVRVINLDLVRPLGRANDGLMPDPNSVAIMVPQMLQALAFVNQRRWPPLKVREVEQTLRRKNQDPEQPHCLAGEGAYATVRPDGGIFACSSLCGRALFSAGSLERPEPQGLRSLARRLPVPEQCFSCPARPACRGGCPARRWATAGPGAVCESECALRLALWERLAL